MKKILLAEHDSFLINVYAGQFRKLGYNISVATSGDIVVSRIKNDVPDLLVMDACLPNNSFEGDGLIIIKTLREELGLKDLKIVVLSDFGHTHLESDFNLGISKFFSKAENTAEEIAREIGSILS